MKAHGRRARLGGTLAAVLATAAILALPAIGLGKHGGDDRPDSGSGPRPAGTVASFEGGVLTVEVAGGGQIAAKVVRRTHVRCGESGQRGRRHRQRQRRGRGGDDRPAGISRRGSDDDRRGAESGRDDDAGRRGDGSVDDDSGAREGDSGNRSGPGKGRRCRGALVPGATVIKAEIVLTQWGAFFEKVGLSPPQAGVPGAGAGGA